MYCMKCGVGNSDDARFCLSCGEKLVPLAEPSLSSSASLTGAATAPAPAAVPSTDPTQTQPPISDPELPSLKGVGGWLLWFCIALLIIQPILNFGSALGDPFGMAVAFILSGLSIITAIMLILEKQSGLTWVKWYFAVYAGVLVLGLTGTIIDSVGNNQLEPVAGEQTVKEIVALLRGLIFVTVWGFLLQALQPRACDFWAESLVVQVEAATRA